MKKKQPLKGMTVSMWQEAQLAQRERAPNIALPYGAKTISIC